MSALIAQYFLNHRLDPDELEWQVEEIAKAGYQGLLAHARAGLLTPYMSEDWWQCIKKIMEVCRRTGLEFWIWDDDYFPSGLAGGRVVWNNPGLVSRQLDFTVTTLEGKGPFEVDFSPGMLLKAFVVKNLSGGGCGHPVDVTGFCGTRRQQWSERQIKHSAYSPLINNIAHPHWRCAVNDNRFAVVWKPPRVGSYTVVGIMVGTGYTNTHPDILRPEGIAEFIRQSYQPYYERFGKEFGKTLKGSFTDEPSPGASCYPWTGVFPEEFRKDHGYDVLDYLAHLVLDIDGRSPAVRHHYRLTQHRLQSKNYVGQLGAWCRKRKISLAGHLTRTEWLTLAAAWWPNELRCYKDIDIPCADPLGGSMGWKSAAPYHTGLKVVSSAAHLFGKKQAGNDTLAVLGDEATLRELKYHFDYQLALGINYFAVHGLSSSIDGPRKDEVPPSIFYQHTEWKHMRVLMEHVRRTSEALTGGKHLCEVAVVYPSTTLACQIKPSEDFYTQFCLPDEVSIHGLVEELLSHHCDFDFIDEVTLQENITEDGKIKTPEPYRFIILPHLRFIDAATAKSLVKFARSGGTVLAVEVMPTAITGDIKKPLVSWADGHVRLCKSADAVWKLLPCLPVKGARNNDIFVLRREKNGEQIFFALNRNNREFQGEITGVPVVIPQQGSVLISGKQAPSVKNEKLAADISQGWTVQFDANHVPLNFWHVRQPSERPVLLTPFDLPGFDLMRREKDPAGKGNDGVRYYCRFMVTGAISRAQLVIEESAVSGDWKIFVNEKEIKRWQKTLIYDCRNYAADVSTCLCGGSTPTLNVVCVETTGPNRGLNEVLYLYGSFTGNYRYGHLSLPFLSGCDKEMPVDILQPWNVLGYPTFSGSARYTRTLKIEEEGSYFLDLGRVEDVAAVHLDGKECGVCAWPPYRCFLKKLKPGHYTLSVEISNAPANRNRAAGLPAGLLGPVKLFRQKSPFTSSSAEDKYTFQSEQTSGKQPNDKRRNSSEIPL